MLVSTKPPLKELIQETAEECGLPYINEKWIGGIFTNFKIIKKRIEYFKQLENLEKENGFAKYTKKERIKTKRVLENFRKKFEGVKNMDDLPDAVFICDITKDKLCLRESKAKGIKTIAIVDTNADPTTVDYPIPANDDSIPSVKYILDKVKDVIKKAKSSK